MRTLAFKDFLSKIIIEKLHPELQSIVAQKSGNKNKQTLFAKKARELIQNGEVTGIEGNAPKGSSRAVAIHSDPHTITLDGQENVPIKSITKFAINSSLDKHRDPHAYPETLGTMQNETENGDYWIDNTYRVLVEDSEHPGHFKTHKEGIFPPKFDHDHDSHQWSHLGYARNLKAGDFRRLTKSVDHPKGITHQEFCEALKRNFLRNEGRYWEGTENHERHLDHIDKHPLVQTFQDYHGNTGSSPYDWEQKANLGVFTHPVTGDEQIVGRDHGFGAEVEKAYADARLNRAIRREIKRR